MELFNNKVQFVLNMDLQNKQLAEYSDLKFHCPSKYKTKIKQDALFLMLKYFFLIDCNVVLFPLKNISLTRRHHSSINVISFH